MDELEEVFLNDIDNDNKPEPINIFPNPNRFLENKKTYKQARKLYKELEEKENEEYKQARERFKNKQLNNELIKIERKYKLLKNKVKEDLKYNKYRILFQYYDSSESEKLNNELVRINKLKLKSQYPIRIVSKIKKSQKKIIQYYKNNIINSFDITIINNKILPLFNKIPKTTEIIFYLDPDEKITDYIISGELYKYLTKYENLPKLVTSFKVQKASYKNNVYYDFKVKRNINNMCYVDILYTNAFKDNDITNHFKYFIKAHNALTDDNFPTELAEFKDTEKYKSGFTIKEILNILEFKNKGYILYDALDRVLTEKDAKKQVYMKVQNGHLTILSNKLKQDSIKTTNNKYKTKDKPTEIEYITQEELINLVPQADKIQTKAHNINTIYIADKIYTVKEKPNITNIYNDIYEKYASYSDLIQLQSPTFFIETITGFARDEYMQKMILGNEEIIPSEWNNAYEIDITKCYTSIIDTYELPIISNTDKWTDEKPEEGFYYFVADRDYENYRIHENDQLPMQYLEFLEFKPKKYLKLKTFSAKSYIKLIQSQHPDDWKFNLNCLVGMFAIDYTIIGKKAAYINNSDELAYYDGEFLYNFPIDINGETHYIVEKIEKRPNTKNLRSCFNFIVQIMNLKIIDMMQQIEPENILGYYMDCIYTKVEYNNLKDNVTKKSKYGKYICKSKGTPKAGVLNKYTHKFPHGELIEKNEPIHYKFDKDEEIDICRGKTTLINSAPGSGKSTIINKFVEDYPDEKCLIITPTNISANIINGQTIHKAIATNKINKVYDVLIIDEFSMISVDLWNIIIHHSKNFNTIIICGDLNQLPPIENENFNILDTYFNIDYIYNLDFTYRFSDEQFRIAKRLLNENFTLEELKTLLCKNLPIPEDYIILTTTNARVAEENKKPARRYIVLENDKIAKNTIVKKIKGLNPLKPPENSERSTPFKNPESSEDFHYYTDPDFNNKSIKTNLCDQDLKPANAITVHKSQGTTIKIPVVLYLDDFYQSWINKDLQKKLLYVAYTRSVIMPVCF